MHAVFYHEHAVSVEIRDLDLGSHGQNVRCNNTVSNLSSRSCGKWRVISLPNSGRIGGNHHQYLAYHPLRGFRACKGQERMRLHRNQLGKRLKVRHFWVLNLKNRGKACQGNREAHNEYLLDCVFHTKTPSRGQISIYHTGSKKSRVRSSACMAALKLSTYGRLTLFFGLIKSMLGAHKISCIHTIDSYTRYGMMDS